MSLEQLIHKCKNNDRDAQAQLYNLYAKKLYATSLKYSRNRLEAEDNLQDSFMVIFEKISQYTFKGSFEGWLRRVTVNTVLQKYRSKGVFEVINERVLEEKPVTVYEEDVSLDFLLSIVQELPDRYRLVFNLYELLPSLNIVTSFPFNFNNLIRLIGFESTSPFIKMLSKVDFKFSVSKKEFLNSNPKKNHDLHRDFLYSVKA